MTINNNDLFDSSVINAKIGRNFIFSLLVLHIINKQVIFIRIETQVSLIIVLNVKQYPFSLRMWVAIVTRPDITISHQVVCRVETKAWGWAVQLRVSRPIPRRCWVPPHLYVTTATVPFNYLQDVRLSLSQISKKR